MPYYAIKTSCGAKKRNFVLKSLNESTAKIAALNKSPPGWRVNAVQLLQGQAELMPAPVGDHTV